MWDLYDRLIAEVEDLEVKNAVIGLYWSAVQSKTVGLAMGAPRPRKNFRLTGELTGKSTKELAKSVKSWEQVEASVGLSTINSTINTVDTVSKLQNDGYINKENLSIFDELAVIGKGKKIGVIGHFPVLDRIKDVCQLTVFERVQQEGDLPDPAAEYLLKEQDIVLMTSSTIINKTAPRLLELTGDAFTIMVGPSTPLSTILFDMGADMLAGLAVKNETSVLNYVQQAGDLKDYRNDVQNVNLIKPNHSFSQLLL